MILQVCLGVRNISKSSHLHNIIWFWWTQFRFVKVKYYYLLKIEPVWLKDLICDVIKRQTFKTEKLHLEDSVRLTLACFYHFNALITEDGS